jgi:hypothetical protein
LWSSGGAPLLTGWGRRRARETGPSTGIVGETTVARAPVRAQRGRGFIPGLAWTAAPAGGEVQTRVVGIELNWLAWALFCLLAAMIFYRLLPACRINLPLIGWANYCAAPGIAELTELGVRNAYLRDSVLDAEKRVAEICAARPAVAPGLDETRKRADKAGLRHGRFEVTLAWEGLQDLDLYVDCPGGRLYHGSTSACGGVLDHDANRTPETAVEHPLEHATWERDPPPGAYRIVVNYYDHGQPIRPVPFTVVVRSGSDEKSYNGVARAYGVEVEVARLTR